MRRRRSAVVEANSATTSADPEQAWKALTLVNDWVKHAETKLAAVLAATGVTGVILFNLVKDRTHYSHIYAVAAAICCASIVAAGIFGVIGLYPRVRLQAKLEEDTANPLFFHDVARAYKGDAPSYTGVLHTLTTNPDDLVRHISQQVHANAVVAHRKYQWANRAIRALILDLLALGTVAALTALKR